MLASLDISLQTDYFIREEERLLGQLLQLRNQHRNVSGRRAAEGVSKGVQVIVTDLFSSPFAAGMRRVSLKPTFVKLGKRY